MYYMHVQYRTVRVREPRMQPPVAGAARARRSINRRGRRSDDDRSLSSFQRLGGFVVPNADGAAQTRDESKKGQERREKERERERERERETREREKARDLSCSSCMASSSPACSSPSSRRPPLRPEIARSVLPSLSICLSVRPSFCLSVCLPVRLCVCASVRLSVCLCVSLALSSPSVLTGNHQSGMMSGSDVVTAVCKDHQACPL
eukprot:COSAG02_NODE_9695_length_2138_cov_2.597842_4_plen_206_part_00